MSARHDSRYREFWDNYVVEVFPDIKKRGRFKKEDLEEWRVLNTTDASFEWPGDEWGDLRLTDEIFSSSLVEALDREPSYLCELGAGAGRYTVLALQRFARASILSFDVSREFERALRERCAGAIEDGRLETVLLDQSHSTMLDALEERGLNERIDGIYSFDAMVHVDLDTLVIYFLTAARALRIGGVLAMNVACACSEKGFMKLLCEAPSAYAQCGHAGGQFMWISRDIIECVLTRLGFEVIFKEGNGRDALFSAKLVDRSRSAAWLKRAGATWPSE